MQINSLPLVDFTTALANYTENLSSIVDEKDPILKYVQRAQGSKESAEISIIPNINHMQLFFIARVIKEITKKTKINRISLPNGRFYPGAKLLCLL